MKRTTLAAALAIPAIVSVAAIGHAAGDAPATLEGFAVGDTIGVDEATIGAALAGLGYEMTAMEADEDGYLEVELVAGAAAFELEVDATTGAVLEIEAENDDDEDGEDD